MLDVAFVTTCKGRLHHIKETLPLLAAQDPAEIVVVDYGCPDRVGDWVRDNFPQVKVLRVDDDPGFSAPRARNQGARHARSPWLCLIDGDIKVHGQWTEWMAANLAETHFYRAGLVNGQRDRETYGSVICPRAAFESIGGYDEAFRGWGGEDDDLYTRLGSMAGLTEATYPPTFVEAIHHDDSERVAFYDIKNRQIQRFINTLYRHIKKHLFDLQITGIPLATRESFMDSLKASLGGGIPKLFSIDLGRHELEQSNGERRTYSLSIQRKRKFVVLGKRELTISAVAVSGQ